MRGHIPGIIINNVHGCNFDMKYKNCNGYGHLNKNYRIFASENGYKYYYVDHYYCKSTEEFIDKINKGDAFFTRQSYVYHRIDK